MEIFRQAGLFSFIALFVSAAPVAAGLIVAVRPSERWLAVMRPLSLAGIFAAVSNLLSGLVNALHTWRRPHPPTRHRSARPRWSSPRPR